jgi:streptogramin lyase
MEDSDAHAGILGAREVRPGGREEKDDDQDKPGFDPPTPKNGAYAISIDTKNNLIWVTLHTVDKIARFNPVTKEWVEFPLPQAETDVRRIEFDPNKPNRVWSSCGQLRQDRIRELLDE